jgi:hypothetical protein
MKENTSADAYFVTIMEESSPEFEFEDWEGNSPVYKLVFNKGLTLDTTLPTVAVRGDGRPLNDVFWVHSNGNAVSSKFKAIIEEVEPGVHWFFPLKLRNVDGSFIDEPYFMFAVRQHCVCVLPEKSSCRAPGIVKYGPNAGMPYQRCHDNNLVLSGPAIATRKLFSTSLIGAGKLIVSKEIGVRLLVESITGLRMHPAQIVDEEWNLEKHAPRFAEWYRDHPEQQA